MNISMPGSLHQAIHVMKTALRAHQRNDEIRMKNRARRNLLR